MRGYCSKQLKFYVSHILLVGLSLDYATCFYLISNTINRVWKHFIYLSLRTYLNVFSLPIEEREEEVVSKSE